MVESTLKIMKIGIVSLGCKVNQCETEQLAKLFIDSGFEVSYGLKPADIFLLNTCAVTGEAESKSRQTVSKLIGLNPNCKVLVCGCASELNAEKFSCLANVSYVCGTAEKEQLFSAVLKLRGDNGNVFLSNENDGAAILLRENTGNAEINKQKKGAVISISEKPLKYKDISVGIVNRIRHFVKIQDGCNNFCSYCIVPYLRGRSRSKPLMEVLEQIKVVEANAQEAVLAGIDVSAYGKDIGTSLTELLRQLKNIKIRLRLSSLEVGCVTQEFLSAVKECKNFCGFFHLSLQSGCDKTLKAMNRKYSTAGFAEAVGLIRSVFPDAAISTDLIVGFPGETDEDFLRSMEFVRQMNFSNIHCFNYSVREGTVAASMPQVDGQTKARRMKELMKLKTVLALKWARSQVGKTASVLVESVKNRQAFGYSENYTAVKLDTGAKVKNKIVKVRLTVAEADGSLIGELI